MSHYTYKKIGNITYKMPLSHRDRENNVGLSEDDMIDILHRAQENKVLNELLQKVKNIYFMTYSESVHPDGVKTMAGPEIQKMTSEQLYDHNLVLEVVKKAQGLGW
jgi:hypothetical protein